MVRIDIADYATLTAMAARNGRTMKQEIAALLLAHAPDPQAAMPTAGSASVAGQGAVGQREPLNTRRCRMCGAMSLPSSLACQDCGTGAS
jgi:hypothetical protein